MDQLDTPNACYLCHPFLLGEKQVSRRATRYLNIRERHAVWPKRRERCDAGSTSYWDMHRALGTCNDKNFFLEISRIESDDISLTCFTWPLGAHHGSFLQNESSQHNFFLAPLRDNRAAVKVSSPKLLDLAFQIVFDSPGKMGSAPALAQTHPPTSAQIFGVAWPTEIDRP